MSGLPNFESYQQKSKSLDSLALSFQQLKLCGSSQLSLLGPHLRNVEAPRGVLEKEGWGISISTEQRGGTFQRAECELSEDEGRLPAPVEQAFYPQPEREQPPHLPPSWATSNKKKIFLPLAQKWIDLPLEMRTFQGEWEETLPPAGTNVKTQPKGSPGQGEWNFPTETLPPAGTNVKPQFSLPILQPPSPPGFQLVRGRAVPDHRGLPSWAPPPYPGQLSPVPQPQYSMGFGIPPFPAEFDGDRRNLAYFLHQIEVYIEENRHLFRTERQLMHKITQGMSKGEAKKWVASLHREGAPELNDLREFMQLMTTQFHDIAENIEAEAQI